VTARVVIAAVGGFGVFFLAPILAVIAVGEGTPAAAGTSPGGLRPGSVPAADQASVLAAGKTCETVTPALLATQIEAESGWNPTAISPAGAQGLSQFMPGTWGRWGVDGDGDGVADPFNPLDAIPSQARYDCVLAAQVAAVAGDPAQNMLAAYNAGPDRVLLAGGIPPIAETQAYVRRIMELIPQYQAAVIPPVGSTGTVIQTAMSFLGTPYVWGGDGPTGFDCSGFTSYVYLHAAGKPLPRTAAAQQAWAIPTTDPQPGDLVFFGPPIHHVGLYLGNGQMIDSPHSGAVVRIEAVFSDVAGYGRVP
jgi:hypothetical protein